MKFKGGPMDGLDAPDINGEYMSVTILCHEHDPEGGTIRHFEYSHETTIPGGSYFEFRGYRDEPVALETDWTAN